MIRIISSMMKSIYISDYPMQDYYSAMSLQSCERYSYYRYHKFCQSFILLFAFIM